MSITQEKKAELIKEFCLEENDTGSPEVQVSILTERIKNLTEHLKNHKNDNHTRRGLVKIVSKRKKLLNHLHKNNYEKYQSLIKELGIRG